MSRRYAEDTKVPVEQSRAEIERTLERYGATAFAYAAEPTQATILFEADKRRIRFCVPLPDRLDLKDQRLNEKERRRIFRALLLCLKARLEGVQSGIESFEEAFLAHVVMPDGKTVMEHTAPAITAAYKSGKMQSLLPGPQAGG